MLEDVVDRAFGIVKCPSMRFLRRPEAKRADLRVVAGK